MDDYWHAISQEHKDKIIYLAEKRNISVEQAFRNILKQLEWEAADQPGPGKFEEMLTIRQIERMLDDIEP